MTHRAIAATLCAALFLANPLVGQEPLTHEVTPQLAIPQAPLAEFAAPAPAYYAPTWGSVEYLIGWFDGMNLPPLVTTSPSSTTIGNAGVLGLSSTSVLFGNGSVNNGGHSGIRFQTGCGIDSAGVLAFESGFLMTETQSTLFGISSNTNPVIARPFQNAATGASQSLVVAYPGTATGRLDVRASSGNLYQANFDISERVYQTEGFRFSSLIGYRFFRYDEGLRVRQQAAPLGVKFVPGTQIISIDDFSAQNQFHGLDLGLRSEFDWNNFSLSLLGKLAIGQNYQQVNISGSQTTFVPGSAAVVQSGGVLALVSNIGSTSRREWAMLPELSATLKWRASENLNLRVSYMLLFLDEAARAGQQIDTVLDPNLFPPSGSAQTTPARPQADVKSTHFTAQFLTFGAELVF